MNNPREDRSARAYGVANRPGVWIDAGIRRIRHGGFRDHPRRDPGASQVRSAGSARCCPSSRTSGSLSFRRTSRFETSRESVERIAGVRTVPRTWLPVEIYPISAGIKGGLAGGVAMALLAALYGIVERQRDLVSDESSGGRIVSRDGDGDCQPDRSLQPLQRFWSPFRFTC